MATLHTAPGTATAAQPIRVGGPYFEDFAVGQVFDDAPAMTLTAGHAALHQALVGDRLCLHHQHDGDSRGGAPSERRRAWSGAQFIGLMA